MNTNGVSLFKCRKTILTDSQPWHDRGKSFRSDSIPNTVESFSTRSELNGSPENHVFLEMGIY